MTDQDPDEVPENPEVAALLRASRVEEPMPAPVAARLDEVIAGLASERAGTTNVVPLRRRVARIGAAAAAFVLLAGGAFAASGLLHGSGGSADSSNAPQARALRSPDAPGMRQAESTGASPEDKSVQGLTDSVMAPSLHRARLRQDVLALLGGREAARANGYDAPSRPAPLSGCRTPARTPAGATVRAVTLDGTPAVLVVPHGTGPSIVARVYSCDGSNVLARTTLASQ